MQAVLASIAAGRVEPVYLVRGDRVLAEPMAVRLATALGERFGCVAEWLRRPAQLADPVADLRTYSLFASGKVLVVVESGGLADRTTAGALFDEVRPVLPWSGGADDLTGKSRDAALRLLQILRLFDIAVNPGQAAKALSALPAAVFAGKSGRAAKGKGAVDELRTGLEALLEAAVAAGLRGAGEGDASLVADLLRDGLPEGHALVLVESAVAEGHPLIGTLERRGAVIDAGTLTLERGGKFAGIGELAAELERETGVRIDRDALDALAQRTLRGEDRRRGGDEGAVQADSTARFAGEYRKLASLLPRAEPTDGKSGGGAAGNRAKASIPLELVRRNVEDRGEEDLWGILDAIGAGKSAEALTRLARKFAGADDPLLERLGFLSNLATLCRRIVAVRGIAALHQLPLTEGNYKRFEAQLFPRFTAKVEGIADNPLAGMRSAYPLFKVYQACSRLPAASVDRLPALVLETERRLKGESGEPDAALAELVLAVSRPV